MSLLLDWISILFLSCVLLISSMVILYRRDYIFYDKFNYRFLVLILLFIISIFFLIIRPNLIRILLGWDGLGLVSYCLVIYFGNYKSYNAGILTILINRLGDVSILLSLYIIFNFGDWVFSYYLIYWEDWISFLIIFILLASFTKSAQIPFSSWLPAAIAAPTPVSSLVHSSTLVTAGVYLLIRFSYILSNIDLSPFLFLSLMTIFIAGLGANFEYDLKRIIALSTLSQLGIIITILFIGGYNISFFHLISHAFFKALLFLCAGLIIHSMSDSQDIRHIGNLITQLPYTCSCFCVASLSLCGGPFLSGFYRKDLILEFCGSLYINLFTFIILFISVGLTVSYSIRLIYYCVRDYNGLFVYQSCVERFNILLSIIGLSIISIIGGRILTWLLFPVPREVYMSIIHKVLPLIFIFLGVYLGYELSFLYWFSTLKGHIMNYIYSYFGSIWFLPFFSTKMLIFPFFNISNVYWNFNDSIWGEFFISRLIPQFNYLLSRNIFLIDNRNTKTYIVLFILFICALLLIC